MAKGEGKQSTGRVRKPSIAAAKNANHKITLCIMPEPEKSWSQHSYALGRTGAEQEQTQATPRGQTQRRTMQECKGSQRRRATDGRNPYNTNPAGTPEQDLNNATSCAHGDAGQGRQQGQGETGQERHCSQLSRLSEVSIPLWIRLYVQTYLHTMGTKSNALAASSTVSAASISDPADARSKSSPSAQVDNRAFL